MSELVICSQDPFISYPTFSAAFFRVPLNTHVSGHVASTDSVLGDVRQSLYYTVVGNGEGLIRKLSLLLKCFLNALTQTFFFCVSSPKRKEGKKG